MVTCLIFSHTTIHHHAHTHQLVTIVALSSNAFSIFVVLGLDLHCLSLCLYPCLLCLFVHICCSESLCFIRASCFDVFSLLAICLTSSYYNRSLIFANLCKDASGGAILNIMLVTFWGHAIVALVCCSMFWEMHLGVILVSFGGHVGVILGVILGSFWGRFGVVLGPPRGWPYKYAIFSVLDTNLGPNLSPSWAPSGAKLGSKSTFNFTQISSSFLKRFWTLLGSILGAFWAPKSTPKTILR